MFFNRERSSLHYPIIWWTFPQGGQLPRVAMSSYFNVARYCTKINLKWPWNHPRSSLLALLPNTCSWFIVTTSLSRTATNISPNTCEQTQCIPISTGRTQKVAPPATYTLLPSLVGKCRKKMTKLCWLNQDNPYFSVFERHAELTEREHGLIEKTEWSSSSLDLNPLHNHTWVWVILELFRFCLLYTSDAADE